MLTYPSIDPILFSLGSVSIRWYGLMYLVGFAAAFGSCFCRRHAEWSLDTLADLFFYAALGVIFGGTLGYLLFYAPHHLLEKPWLALQFWEPGRSFHGGLVGVILALWAFSRIHQRSLLAVSDFLVPAVPLGIAAGRLGNFLNGELWGRITSMPWGMVFPHAGPLPRHPSQLYEFFLEGILLFILLAWFNRKPRRRGAMTGMFFLGYGIFRACVECFREPDISQGFIFDGWMTMGQALSLPMILVGVFLLGGFQPRHQE